MYAFCPPVTYDAVTACPSDNCLLILCSLIVLKFRLDVAMTVAEPLANQHVRYAYARSLRQKATKDMASKAWKSANDALTRVGALLLGTTADFSRDTLTQQCECAFRLRNVKVAARTCDNALKKQPQSKIAAEAAKWAKAEKRKQSTFSHNLPILQLTPSNTGAWP